MATLADSYTRTRFYIALRACAIAALACVGLLAIIYSRPEQIHWEGGNKDTAYNIGDVLRHPTALSVATGFCVITNLISICHARTKDDQVHVELLDVLVLVDVVGICGWQTL
jgi:hypothetical protein